LPCRNTLGPGLAATPLAAASDLSKRTGGIAASAPDYLACSPQNAKKNSTSETSGGKADRASRPRAACSSPTRSTISLGRTASAARSAGLGESLSTVARPFGSWQTNLTRTRCCRSRPSGRPPSPTAARGVPPAPVSPRTIRRPSARNAPPSVGEHRRRPVPRSRDTTSSRPLSHHGT
jgi:hypothetical protein